MQHIVEDLPVYIIILLIVCTLSAALSLPLCKMMGNHSAYLLSTWRCALVVLFFLPYAYYEVRTYGQGIIKLFSLKNILLIILSQVYNTLYMLCQLVAMQYTFTSHVLLFSGMISIVLLFWKLVKRLPITTLELGGILVSILGSVIITQTSSNTGSYTKHSIIVGDLISFLGSVFGAFNFQVIAPLLQYYRDGIYAVQANSSSCFLSFCALMLSGEKWEISFDPIIGIFGFLHPSYF